MGLDNIIPSYQVLKAMFKNLSDFRPDKDHFMIISPDEGAINRNMYYASVLGVNLGMFYKRRDYSTIIDGRNPIVAHEYMGNDVAGKDVFIADDIISSGESMLDIAVELKSVKLTRSTAMLLIQFSQTVLSHSTRLMLTASSTVYSAQTSHTELLSYFQAHGSMR